MTFLLVALLIHSWYPQACCGGKDCRPVPCTSIVTHADGSIDWTNLHFSSDMVHASQDGDCHICVAYNDFAKGRWPMCAFIATTT